MNSSNKSNNNSILSFFLYHYNTIHYIYHVQLVYTLRNGKNVYIIIVRRRIYITRVYNVSTLDRIRVYYINIDLPGAEDYLTPVQKSTLDRGKRSVFWILPVLFAVIMYILCYVLWYIIIHNNIYMYIVYYILCIPFCDACIADKRTTKRTHDIRPGRASTTFWKREPEAKRRSVLYTETL